MSESGKGYAFAVLSSVLSGVNYVLGKKVLQNLSPEHLVALIFSMAAIIQAGWMLQSGQWRSIRGCTAKGWGYIFIFSALSIAALWTLWAGVKNLDPSVASFISRLQTMVTVFLGIWLLSERFRAWEALGGIIVILGVAVIYAAAGLEMGWWFWVMVTSAVLWGVTEIIAKVALRHIAATPLSFIRTTLVALFYLLLLAAKGEPLLRLGTNWWGVLGIAIMGPTLARWFYLFALQRLAVSKAALINQVQPLFVFLVAFLWLRTIPSGRELFGGALILVGSVVMIMAQGRVRGWIRGEGKPE